MMAFSLSTGFCISIIAIMLCIFRSVKGELFHSLDKPSIFNRDYDLKRTLIKESLEVHPIEGYGAIEIGKHQFKHIENGKLEIGTFKFVMIWKNDNGNWKISRVISYDH
jgi:hypothetical protein